MDYLLPIMMLGLIVISLFIVVQLRSVSQQQAQLDQRLALLEKSQENAWAAWRADLSALRTESAGQARQGREELSHSLRMFEDSLLSQVNQAAHLQKSQLGLFGEQIDRLASGNEARLEQMRVTVENRLKELQEDNNQKLEKMRQTVDEKLHTSLETRLGESFKLVSDRLEMVHKGLGEMQSLAAGVGDLKKVLTNVKTRGIWGEIQLAIFSNKSSVRSSMPATWSPGPAAMNGWNSLSVCPVRTRARVRYGCLSMPNSRKRIICA